MMRAVSMRVRGEFGCGEGPGYHGLIDRRYVIRVPLEHDLVRLVMQLLHALRQMPGHQVQRGPVVETWRGLVLSWLRILDLLQDLLTHHLVYQGLLLLSVLSCLSDLPDLNFSLVVINNFDDLIIAHLAWVIRRQRIYAIVSPEVLHLVLLPVPQLFLQLPR